MSASDRNLCDWGSDLIGVGADGSAASVARSLLVASINGCARGNLQGREDMRPVVN